MMQVMQDADGCLMVSTDGQNWTYPAGAELRRFSSIDEQEESLAAGDLVRAAFQFTPKSQASSVEIHFSLNFGCFGGSETNGPIGEAGLYVNGSLILTPRWEVDAIGSAEKGAGCVSGHAIIWPGGAFTKIELIATYVGGGKPLRVIGHSMIVKEVA